MVSDFFFGVHCRCHKKCILGSPGSLFSFSSSFVLSLFLLQVQKDLDVKMNAYCQITALLIKRGCKSSAIDINEMTPIMVAAMEGAVGLIGVLATGRATGKKGGTTSDVEEDHISHLIEMEDRSGNTALHYAMAFKQIAAANALEGNTLFFCFCFCFCFFLVSVVVVVVVAVLYCVH